MFIRKANLRTGRWYLQFHRPVGRSVCYLA